MAVAAYDADGALIGELGESGPEVVPCVALPVLLLHASLAISAANLGAVAVGRASSSLLTGHFIQRTPDRPLWEQNPSDAQTLREGAVREASPQLLRAFVQAMYVGVERLGAETSGPEEGGKGPSGASLRESLVEGQVARVKNAKKILLAMHVAASINDQQLLAEGAVRVNNLLAPLLAMPRKSPFLAKALGSCCVTLRSITDVELHPCQSAMPVATQLTVAAIQVRAMPPGGPRLASPCRVQPHGRISIPSVVFAIAASRIRAMCDGPRVRHLPLTQVLSEARESDATKLLSALDSTILQAAGVDSQEELVRLHEMLIRDPQLCSEQPAAIAKRIADEEDIIAKVFQKVSLDDIEEVWTEVGAAPAGCSYLKPRDKGDL